MASNCRVESAAARIRRCGRWLALVCVMGCPPALPAEVGLAGILGSRAMLVIDGGAPKAVRVGESVGDIRLLDIQGEQVTVEIGGKRRLLRIGQYAEGSVSADGGGKVVLTADGQGHFVTTGTINGTSVRFLVDTGASMISLGASDARRIGLDPGRGEKALSNTANGQVVVSRVQLAAVRVGEITLSNVDALIHQAEMPVALLGMSFLNRMEMQRDGSTMILKKRF